MSKKYCTSIIINKNDLFQANYAPIVCTYSVWLFNVQLNKIYEPTKLHIYTNIFMFTYTANVPKIICTLCRVANEACVLFYLL